MTPGIHLVDKEVEHERLLANFKAEVKAHVKTQRERDMLRVNQNVLMETCANLLAHWDQMENDTRAEIPEGVVSAVDAILELLGAPEK